MRFISLLLSFSIQPSMAKAGYTFTNMDAGPPGNCGNGQHLALRFLRRTGGFDADSLGFNGDLMVI